MNAILSTRQRGVALSPEVEAEIIGLYQSGAQRQQIMATVGVGKSTVSDVLSRNGVALRYPRTGPNPERDALVVQMYKAGAERKDITAATGVPNSTITHVLKRNGVEDAHVRRSPVSSERAEAIAKLYLEGKSYAQIQQALGISRNSVAGIIYRRGIQRSEEINEANRKLSRRYRADRPKAAPKPKLVAVAAPDGERVLLAPEAEAAKIAAQEAEPQILTSGEDPLVILRALDCKWPIGDPGKPGFRFCCASRAGAGPYCPEHEKRAYTASSPRPPKTEPTRVRLRRVA
jgi:GcrA cell cycle regulator